MRRHTTPTGANQVADKTAGTWHDAGPGSGSSGLVPAPGQADRERPAALAKPSTPSLNASIAGLIAASSSGSRHGDDHQRIGRGGLPIWGSLPFPRLGRAAHALESGGGGRPRSQGGTPPMKLNLHLCAAAQGADRPPTRGLAGRRPAPEPDLSHHRPGLLVLAPGRSGLCDELAPCEKRG